MFAESITVFFSCASITPREIERNKDREKERVGEREKENERKIERDTQREGERQREREGTMTADDCRMRASDHRLLSPTHTHTHISIIVRYLG